MKNLALILLVQIAVAGCALIPERGTDSAPEANAIIAEDLVSVLRQIDTLDPGNSVLWIPDTTLPANPFSTALTESLQRAGYAIRVDGHAGTAIPVSHTVTVQAAQTGSSANTYTVTIGNVSVRRAYSIAREGKGALQAVFPSGGMQIRGADARTLVIDDSRFAQTHDELPRGATRAIAVTPPAAPVVVEPENDPVPVPAPPVVPEPVATQTPELVASVQPRELLPQLERGQPPLLDIVAPSVSKTSSNADRAWSETITRLSKAPTLNVRELGQSNFADVLDDLGIVRETILTFDNDSTFLGQTNKARVRQIVELFEPESDVFSVIGCSNGGTSLAIGQEGLAMGRAARVVEELLYVGIPERSILDEGCWAAEAFDERMPRRGVVLTLKRAISS